MRWSKIRSHVDTVIVGGGIVGSSILYQLSKKGLVNTVLIEKNKFASGSTNASGGFLRMFHQSFQHTVMAYEGFNEFEEMKEKCKFNKTGMAYIINEKKHKNHRSQVDWLQQRNINIDYLPSSKYHRLINTVNLKSSDIVVYEEEAGYIDPIICTDEWIAKSKKLGANAYEGIEVEKILVNKEGIKGIQTSYGKINCNNLILATGAWTNKLLRPLGIDLNLYSKAIQINFFNKNENISISSPIIIDDNTDIYLRPYLEKNILIGEPTNEFDIDPDEKMSLNYQDTIKLINRNHLKYDWLEFTNFSGGRRSFDGFTRDSKGILKEDENIKGLIIATGWSGGGVKLSPSIGKKVTKLILSKEEINNETV
ncbi:FAD-dependent oxidoreductase [Niallia taxi]|uniref:NAD(P)/FAD-dependent oxidoreductase n=1 Tax=Niallia taxi TaxID=2499688 RepID=UPI002041A448|nr:FAD-dependent oxidoreductase [Niallia taxi]MCM3216675.1 FAD-binding oxidoreductase [Niallia taxi]